MPSEILDEISKNNDKIYLVTKKAGEEGEKNIWGLIMIQDGGEDDFRKEMEKCVGVVDDTGPGIFHKIFSGIFNNKSAIFQGSLMSGLGIAGYSKYVMDGYTNNKVETDKTDDTTENFENLESKRIDWIIFYLSIANIVYASKGIILKIFKKLFNQVFGGGDKAVLEAGGDLVATGVKEKGQGIAAGVKEKGQGIAAAIAAAAKKGTDKGKTTTERVKIKNPLFGEQGGGGGISDVVEPILGFILSLIQFVLGIYFLDKSYASLYP